jgi:hypothetical protein
LKSVNSLRQCGGIFYFKPSVHVAYWTAGGAAPVSEGLNTAKELGLTVPYSVLARADELIE